MPRERRVRSERRTPAAWHFSTALVAAMLASACGRLALDHPGVVPPPPPPAPLPSDHPVVGLVSAVAGTDRLRADWRVHSGGDPTTELALFVGTDAATVFATTPIPLAATERRREIAGLATDQDYAIGLGERASPADAWTPSGPVLRVRTGAVLFVDPAGPASGDGSSPANALNDVTLAVLTAFANGGGNVWVAQGDFANVSIPLFTGVHLYGGFAPSFRLSERDAIANPTRFLGIAGLPIVETQNGSGIAVLDGFELDGLSATTGASDGVSETNEEVELRSLSIHDCGRGVKLRALASLVTVRVVLTNVACRANALEGVSIDGTFDVVVEGCLFDSNANEGMDLNHLVAPELGSASLVARGSRFDRNGTEGLDCHLGAPPGAGHGGGRFTIDVQDCDFESNELDGVRVDVDYEAFPEWSAAIAVRGCRARANRAAGVHFDLDSRASAIAHRIACSANRGDGFALTSESFAGQCTLSASALFANAGHGASSTFGRFGLCVSHCVVAGNLAGGVASELVPSIAVSCVLDRQPNALANTVAVGCVTTIAGSVSPFVNAPEEYARVDAVTAAGVTVDATPLARIGSTAELEDDDVARALVSRGGTSVVLDPVPSPVAVPAVLAFFAPSGVVAEDWRLAPGAAALLAGLAAPGGPAIDAGIFGARSGGVPGRETAPVPAAFHLATTTPAWSDGIASGVELELAFEGGTPDAATVATSVFAFDAGGVERAIVPSAVAGTIRVPAPAGGWRTGDVLAVFASLRSTDGAPLIATAAIPILAH